MYFNTFATTTDAIDLSGSEEMASLLQSARDLGIAHPQTVRYRSRNLVANGQRFHLLEWGDPAAPPIVLFHGANQTGHSWDLVSLNLSSDFHVMAVDQRGHGDSEWPRDADMSSSAMVRDAEAIVRQVSPGRAPVIMGHSMGGQNVLGLVTQHPGVASRIVIVDTGPSAGGEPSEGARRIQAFVAESQEWESVDAYIAAISAYDTFRSKEHILRTMKYNVMERADGKLVTKHFPRSLRVAPADPVRAAAIGMRRITFEDVAKIDIPVLITRGGESNVLSPENAVLFEKALPNGKLVTVPNCGHNVHSQNTPGFLAEVRPFLGLD